MDTTTFATFFAGFALLATLAQLIFGGGWNLQKNITGIERALKEAIEEARRHFDDRQRAESVIVGETIAAMKEHVRQVEFHVRDNYIRKDDFIVHMKAHDELLRANFSAIIARLERMEKHLDNK